MHRARSVCAVPAAAGGLAVLALVTGCPGITGGGTADTTVTADDHVLGSASAPITVIEYGDFECPACRGFNVGTFPAIKSQYIDTGRVRWVWRHIPLQSTSSQTAAAASECAGEQGRFWEFADQMLRPGSSLDTNALRDYAEQANLDLPTFAACLTNPQMFAAVEEDVARADAAGVVATPTFIMNGRRVVGALTFGEFAGIVAELEAQ